MLKTLASASSRQKRQSTAVFATLQSSLVSKRTWHLFPAASLSTHYFNLLLLNYTLKNNLHNLQLSHSHLNNCNFGWNAFHSSAVVEQMTQVSTEFRTLDENKRATNAENLAGVAWRQKAVRWRLFSGEVPNSSVYIRVSSIISGWIELARAYLFGSITMALLPALSVGNKERKKNCIQHVNSHPRGIEMKKTSS